MRCWGLGQVGVLGTDNTDRIANVNGIGYILFSDNTEIVDLAGGSNAKHVPRSGIYIYIF